MTNNDHRQENLDPAAAEWGVESADSVSAEAGAETSSEDPAELAEKLTSQAAQEIQVAETSIDAGQAQAKQYLEQSALLSLDERMGSAEDRSPLPKAEFLALKRQSRSLFERFKDRVAQAVRQAGPKRDLKELDLPPPPLNAEQLRAADRAHIEQVFEGKIQPPEEKQPEELSPEAITAAKTNRQTEETAFTSLEEKMGATEEKFKTEPKEKGFRGIFNRVKDHLAQIVQARAETKALTKKQKQAEQDRAGIERIFEGNPAAEAAAERIDQLSADADRIYFLQAGINQAIEDGNAEALKILAESCILQWEEHAARVAAEAVSAEDLKFYKTVLQGKAELPQEESSFGNVLQKEIDRINEAISKLEEAPQTKAAPEEIPLSPMSEEAASTAAEPHEETFAVAAPESRAEAVELSSAVLALLKAQTAQIENRLREIDRLAGSHDERQKAGTTMQKLEAEAALLLDEKNLLDRGIASEPAVADEIKTLENKLRQVESKLKIEKETLSPEEKTKLYKQGEALEAERKQLKIYLSSEKTETLKIEEQSVEDAPAQITAENEIELEFIDELEEARNKKEYVKTLEKYIDISAKLNELASRLDMTKLSEEENQLISDLVKQRQELQLHKKFAGLPNKKSETEIAELISNRVSELRQAA